MSDLNLSALADEIVAEAADLDPQSMAKELVRRLDPDDYEAALLQMAPHYISRAAHRTRLTLRDGDPYHASSKVTGIRDAFAKLLNAAEYVPSEDRWLRLREATRTQVMEMSEARMRLARQNAAAAERYQFLADAMESSGAATVGDLSPDLLRGVLERTAAA